jgi:alpha-1,6-mannosyltransferase
MVKEACAKYPSVHYLGFIKDPKEMASYYASCDMTLALSGWETFGLSILEAMASGLAMIGANTGAASEHIQKSEAGWTIPTSSPLALADQLEKIIIEPKQLDGLGEKAREYAESLSWKHCFDKQVQQYKELIEK